MPLKPNQMSVDDLLQALAFYRGEYTEAALAELERELKARGYRDHQVQSWREQFLLASSADTTCVHCARVLDLNEEELIAGQFECPLCGHVQEVNYQALRQTVFAADLSERLAEAEDASVSGRRSPAMSNDNLLKTLAIEGYRLESGTKDHLKRELVIRGYCRADVRAWREKNIPDESAETKCRKCAATLTLTREDILAREYTCPACRKTQPVQYLRLPSLDPRENPPAGAGAPPLEEKEMTTREIDGLEDTALLEALALREAEYSPATREMMMRRLRSRGYVPEDIVAWRRGRRLSIEKPEAEPIAAYKPGGMLAGLLKGLFIFIVALDALLLAILGFGSYIPGVMGKPLLFGGSALLAADPAAIVVIVLIWCIEGLLPVLFLFWLYRVYRNVIALTSKPTAIKPWIAIVMMLFVIPSIVVPYLMAREILRGGSPADPGHPGSGRSISTAIAKWWWGSFLVMIWFDSIFAGLIHRLWPHLTSWLLLVSIGLNLTAAAFAARLVYRIDHLQAELYVRRMGSPQT
ncbi:MAG: DUF4328 domain-containing protein [candidate division Zixibacteria bacterium]|nr:DUF4328 domain-containing protein [candidate division Zixibacteria bacterium]